MSDVDDDEREVVVDGEEGECRMNRNDEQWNGEQVSSEQWIVNRFEQDTDTDTLPPNTPKDLGPSPVTPLFIFFHKFSCKQINITKYDVFNKY